MWEHVADTVIVNEGSRFQSTSTVSAKIFRNSSSTYFLLQLFRLFKLVQFLLELHISERLSLWVSSYLRVKAKIFGANTLRPNLNVTLIYRYFSWFKLRKNSLEWPGVNLIIMEHKYYIPFSGRSRISQMVRGANPVVETPTYYSANFLQKAAWKLKKLDRKGAYPSPPLDPHMPFSVWELSSDTILFCAKRRLADCNDKLIHVRVA